MKGLDISSYQNGINFDAIKNAGINFLILRAGFTGWGTGVNYNKDNCFENFYKQAKQYGIPVGAYWYSCANNYEKGVAEAKFMYENCLKGKQFEFPIYIDVEDTHHQVNNKRGVTDAIIGFCEYLENLDYYVGIYASDISGFQDKMYLNELNAYDKWVARYGSEPKYVKQYGMWQSTSSGRINGYNGNLDCDVAYKDYSSIIKNIELNGFSKPSTNNTQNINPLNNYSDEEQKKDKIVNQQTTVKKLYLPASADTWRVYDLNVIPVKGNEKGFLRPSKFGGLEYDILGWSQNDVAIIQTRDFGQVQIYVASSTGAIIK